MTEDAWADTIVIAAAAIATFIFTEFVRRFAWRVGAVVRPDERRVHLRPTPTLGGIAMFGGLLVALLVAWVNGSFTEVFANPVQLLGIVGAAAVIHTVGVVDDFRQVSAPAKVAGITFGASLLVIAGVSIVTFRIPRFGLFLLSDDLVPLVTVAVGPGHRQRDQSHRRARRPGGRHRGHRRRLVPRLQHRVA